ncbi:MAG TPA: TIGR03668 family PPOX class F420-dependent oxidoreductase [bacterium]
MLDAAALRFLQAARVGRLATVDARGVPAVVPICYQVEGTRLFTPIDAKPKRADWRSLQRVRNLLARPDVAVVVDRWDEDWRRLGWVHLRGRAELVERGPLHAQGIALLRAKYAQYRAMALEQRPLIVVTLTAATHWGDLTPPETP